MRNYLLGHCRFRMEATDVDTSELLSEFEEGYHGNMLSNEALCVSVGEGDPVGFGG